MSIRISGDCEEMIEISDLTFTYSQAAAPTLSDVNLKIKEGDFVLLTGVSGSGKSTFLRCLNGLVPHFYGGTYKGDVVIGEKSAKTLTVASMSAQVGLVFQDSTSQLVTETVADEVAFGPTNMGLSDNEIKERVTETLDATGLTPLAGRKNVSLSGGERQKVAVASVLAMRPKVLALDEPTAELDPESAEGLLLLLEKMNRDLGLTVILAEHRLERVIGHANMIIDIKAGRAEGGPVTQMLAEIETVPPIIEAGKLLGWQPLPITVEEARKRAKSVRLAKIKPAPGHKRGRVIASLKDVSLSYNGKTAVENISLDIRAGEVLALIGQNGAGKTTLLKLLCGLLKPDTGNVILDGINVQEETRQAVFKRAGYVPQRPGILLFAETVRDEIVNASLIKEMDLEKHADDYPRDLSLGQQQRVALAAVLAKEPPLLLLDEPTHGLDYNVKRDLARLRRIWPPGTKR